MTGIIFGTTGAPELRANIMMKTSMRRNRPYSFAMLFVAAILCAGLISAAPHHSKRTPQTDDSLVSREIEKQLQARSLSLNFPNSTAGWYKPRGNRPVWNLSSPGQPVWESLLLFDRAIQYGLNRRSFHPATVNYQQLARIATRFSAKERASFEILLTDAMLTFINHLHYGQLNPDYPASAIDRMKTPYAPAILASAFSSGSFCESVEHAQPQVAEYQVLQEHLRLAAGQYVGDSYETPEADIRRLAANLERWRWENDLGDTYVAINIPSYTLTFKDGAKHADFRVIVGKPGNPTPIVSSRITHFMTAPDWNVPRRIFMRELLPRALKDAAYLSRNNYELYYPDGSPMRSTPANLRMIWAGELAARLRQVPGCDNALGNLVFRFPNRFSVYLHDTPTKALFDETDRAFSHGCIRLENADKLAELLLAADGDDGVRLRAFRKKFTAQTTETFFLHTPVPIVTRYFTCGVQDGMLIKWKDVYDRDRPISQALFGASRELHDIIQAYNEPRGASSQNINTSEP